MRRKNSPRSLAPAASPSLKSSPTRASCSACRFSAPAAERIPIAIGRKRSKASPTYGEPCMTNLSRRDAVLAAAALAACTPNQIAATTPSAEPEQLADIADAVVRPALAEGGIHGASFVAYDTQSRIDTRHWGLADREANRTVSDKTAWPIASITKTLTATAAMTLVDQRRIDLDADITTYLDDTRIPPFAGPPITLRRLLTHTSGFDEVRGRMCNHADAPERLADFLNRKLVR